MFTVKLFYTLSADESIVVQAPENILSCPDVKYKKQISVTKFASGNRYIFRLYENTQATKNNTRESYLLTIHVKFTTCTVASQILH